MAGSTMIDTVLRRHYTEGLKEGQTVFDLFEWKKVGVEIKDGKAGRSVFKMDDVEVPIAWSNNAAQIAASKYFRKAGVPVEGGRETSMRQVAHRLALGWKSHGLANGYFTDETAAIFYDEIVYMLLAQIAAPNSPQWFNTGLAEAYGITGNATGSHWIPDHKTGEAQPTQDAYSRPQVMACFIQSVQDSMLEEGGIYDLVKSEAALFKFGSGTGSNFSNLRARNEKLSGGGRSSGLMSWLRILDASAGAVKSGGATRRSAKMAILNMDHPDIEMFIGLKAREELKVRALAYGAERWNNDDQAFAKKIGLDLNTHFNGEAYETVNGQNANYSVRITDEFMSKIGKNQNWELKNRTDGQVAKTVKVDDLWNQLNECAWRCADPGVQFDDTMQAWHTCPNSGRINATNPCCFVGETRVVVLWPEKMDKPAETMEIQELARRADAGEPLPLAYCLGTDGIFVFRQIKKAWKSGEARELAKVQMLGGGSFVCTPEHRFLVGDAPRELPTWVPVSHIEPGCALCGTGERIYGTSTHTVEEGVAVFDLEVEEHHNFVIECTGDFDSRRRAVVHNSEYVFLDNTACNLASLNLVKFQTAGKDFDVASYKHAIALWTVVLEISVAMASYPTKAIAERSWSHRPLGLGYANLGALLMRQGLAYDSRKGRTLAAALTAILTGEAYWVSAMLAQQQGAFAAFPENREPMLKVIYKHASYADLLYGTDPNYLTNQAQVSWNHAYAAGREFGYRNSQISVIAPTGCLIPSSLVLTDRGLQRLGNLGNRKGNQWQDAKFKVATDQGPKDATKFYINGVADVIRVRTSRGYEITGTPQHRMKVVDLETGNFVWKKFRDVSGGEWVPTLLGGMFGKPQEVPLVDVSAPYGQAIDRKVRAPEKMTKELAELVGYFMAEGSLHAKGLRFSHAAADVDLRKWSVERAQELFGIEATVEQRENYDVVCLNSTQVARWWSANGLSKTPGKKRGKGWKPRIPDAVLSTNDPSVYAAFLRGLFSGDGTLSSGLPVIDSSSRRFIQDVKTMLLTLGVVTTSSTHIGGLSGKPVYRLIVSSAHYSSVWNSCIGFIPERKSKMVRAAHGHTKKDYIPLSRELIDEIWPITENTPKRRAVLSAIRRCKAVSRHLVQEEFEKTGDARLGHALSFYYDRVKTSMLLKHQQPTYDISVPENVTYVAQGFISHNTISFVMDCDTTGIEPDFSLVKYKDLAGGGSMSIVNQSVAPGLRELGYTESEIEAILKHVKAKNSVVGAPALKEEDYAVFDCAMGERSVSADGHLQMMAVCQPFLSGAISKTVNLPSSASVEEVASINYQAWKLGIKCVALYRDGCKMSQPLNTESQEKPREVFKIDLSALDAEAATKAIAESGRTLGAAEHRTLVPEALGAVRRKLPDNCSSKRHKFSVGEFEGYIHAGMYPDGKLGEIFVRMSKQGSTMGGLLDAFATCASMALQYGVPVETIVKKFAFQKFEPAGITGDRDIPFAQSIIDYIARWIGMEFIPGFREANSPSYRPARPEAPEMAPAGTWISGAAIAAPAAVPEPAGAEQIAHARGILNTPGNDVPCSNCNSTMQRSGTCLTCPTCGSNTGCGG